MRLDVLAHDERLMLRFHTDPEAAMRALFDALQVCWGVLVW